MRENRKLEFKETISNTFLKTVSAFANYDGGEVRFGVADDGTVVGLNNPQEACLAIEGKINDSISPQPDYTLSIDSQHVVVLTVKSGRHTPYLYKAKAYKRNDTSTIEVDPIELTRLILAGQHLHFEELPADNQELSFHVLAQQMEAETGIDNFNRDILKTLELYADKDGYNKAAEILADQNDYPGVDIIRFGESINVIRERKRIEHVSVLTAYAVADAMYQANYQYEEIVGFKRQKVETIPSRAFREAVANALIHRTWDMPAQVRIAMYDDRIDISSPGGLPAGISKEEYLSGRVSTLRNPFLAHVFARLHIVEGIGMGVQRILETYEDSLVKPSFIVTENTIGVVLPVIKQNLGLTDAEQCVYEYLCTVPEAAISKITAASSYGRAKATSVLNHLIDKGLVVRVGNGRGTKYKKA